MLDTQVAHEVETRRGYLSPEFMEARERDTWIPVEENEDTMVICGDDRSVTAESAAKMMQDAPEGRRSPLDVATSLFGGAPGAAKNFLVAGVAAYGEEFIERVGGYYGVLDQLIRLGDGTMTIHTAESAEGNAVQFNPDVESPVGCKYNQLVGATSVLLAKKPAGATGKPAPDSEIQAIARQNQIDTFGNDDHVDVIMEAEQIVADHLATLSKDGSAESFEHDRGEYADLKNKYADQLKVAVLAGPHLPAEETGVIVNFALNEGGRPGKAYRIDAARVTDKILRTVPEYQIPPELLMRAIVMDTAPVRAALYAHDPSHGGHDGPLDPEGLPFGWRGDAQAAIRELNSRYGM